MKWKKTQSGFCSPHCASISLFRSFRTDAAVPVRIPSLFGKKTPHRGRAPVRRKDALFGRRYAHFTVSVAEFVTMDCPLLFFTTHRN